MPAADRQFFFADRKRSYRLAWMMIGATLWLNLLFFVDFAKGMGRGYTDFTVYYTGATILREGLGHHLYDRRVQYEVQEDYAGHVPFRRGPLPYIHPPVEAVIFVPLTLLPYRRALLAFDLLNVAGLVAVAMLLRRSVAALGSIPWWQLVLASFAFFPVFSCLLQGQDSILQLLVCTLGFNALRRRADILGGCWLGLAAFKFQFVIPVVLLLFIWKRRRLVLSFAVVASILGLLSLALVGREGMLAYPGFVLRIVNSPGLGGVPPELLPNLHGLLTGGPRAFSDAMSSFLAMFASIIVFLFAAATGWSPQEPETFALQIPDGQRFDLQLSLAVTVGVLIAWQTNVHDLSLLVLPLAWIANYIRARGKREGRTGFSLLLPALPLLISPLWMVLWLGIARVNLMAIPLLWWTWMMGRELSRDSFRDGWRLWQRNRVNRAE
jgi:hypothetical protein